MRARRDPESQATSARAIRPKNQRARQASRILSGTAWLKNPLFYWTGSRTAAQHFADCVLPARVLLENRLAGLPAGLYAVGLELPATSSPDIRRRRNQPQPEPDVFRLSLQIRAVDPVTRERITQTARSIEALTKFPRAAVKLVGRVDRWCDAARRTLADRRRALEGADALRSGSPDALALEARVMWIGAGGLPSETLAEVALATLTHDSLRDDSGTARLAAIALGRRGQHRACAPRLAAWAAAGRALPRWDPAAIARIASDIGPHTLTAFTDAMVEFNASIAAAWADERMLNPAPVAAGELEGLGKLIAAVPRGGAEDSDGALALVAASTRLTWLGTTGASEAIAAWIDACLPVSPLAASWRDVLSIFTSNREPGNLEGARGFVAALSAHSVRLASELVRIPYDERATVRASLPAVLARGADAADRACRHGLWFEKDQDLDAALQFVAAAERSAHATDDTAAILMPRRVFTCEDPALRDAILGFGLAAWNARSAEARVITLVLDMILTAASRPGAAPWAATLPHLHEAGRLALQRVAPKPVDTGSFIVGDRPVLAFFVLDACARWCAAGFAEPRRLARILSGRWFSSEQAALEWDPDHDDHNRLLIELSEGSIPRLLALLRLPRASRRQAWRSIDGFDTVRKHPTVRSWVSACLDRTELAGRVMRVLQRLGLMATLDGALHPARLFAGVDAKACPMPRWPSWVPAEARPALAEICRATAIAGATERLPAALRRILDRPASMVRERTALDARARQRRLSKAGQARADRLARLASNPSQLRADLSRALLKALPKQRALAGLAALEAIVNSELDQRWRNALGGKGVVADSPAWDNALLMLENVTHNRRILRRLLKQEAQGDRDWFRDLGPNRAFVSCLCAAGVHPDEWLAGRFRTVDAGGNVLTVYATTDPLEVLQMGSLFSTCLSADRFNAHAAVAAAVEINKRVLYVKDREGRVIGRQLLAVLRSGLLIGFTYYGSGSEDRRVVGSWVRIALSLLALDIAHASGVRLMPGARLAEGLTGEEERSLSLFCKGYVDTPEPFDWWIEDLAVSGYAPEEELRSRLRALLLSPVPPHRDARSAPDWKREELGWEACRALLWLGPDAPSLSVSQQRDLGLDDRHQIVRQNSGWTINAERVRPLPQS